MDVLLTQLPSHQTLLEHRLRLQHHTIAELIQQDAKRFEHFSLNAAGWCVDFSKQPLDHSATASLIGLAEDAQLSQKIQALSIGEKLNNTEGRPAWHMALRSPVANKPAEVEQTLARMAILVQQFRQGQLLNQHGQALDQILHIGIGGSYLGPRLVVEALACESKQAFKTCFLSNIDGLNVSNALAELDPNRTLVIVASKTFTTLETLENAKAAKQWLLDANLDVSMHCYALSSNITQACDFGIQPDNILPLWDWVGGRYSLWSAIGLPIALSLGMDIFDQLLAGAAEMDNHFMNAPLKANLPVMLALVGIWQINYHQRSQHAVLAYHHGLRNLAPYLQQLEMESNGKTVNKAGRPLNYATSPTVWGGEGTNGQHAYHQLLHQGSDVIPCDFVVAVNNPANRRNHQAWLFANCLSQSQVLMQGISSAEINHQLQQQGYTEQQAKQLSPHKAMPGNKPSTTLVCQQLDASNLGALIALYEHKVFCQGVIWGINSFDQWGVELGKKISEQVYASLQQPMQDTDLSTQGLISFYQRHNNNK